MLQFRPQNEANKQNIHIRVKKKKTVQSNLHVPPSPISDHLSGGSRGGRGAPPPFIFRANCGPKNRKKIFWTPGPPLLSQGLDDRPSPHPLISKSGSGTAPIQNIKTFSREITAAGTFRKRPLPLFYITALEVSLASFPCNGPLKAWFVFTDTSTSRKRPLNLRILGGRLREVWMYWDIRMLVYRPGCQSLPFFLATCLTILETFRFKDGIDYDNEIFSARAWTSVILAGKRNSLRHSATNFGESTIVAETSSQMLEVLSF